MAASICVTVIFRFPVGVTSTRHDDELILQADRREPCGLGDGSRNTNSHTGSPSLFPQSRCLGHH
jgi:hypothetical protein